MAIRIERLYVPVYRLSNRSYDEPRHVRLQNGTECTLVKGQNIRVPDVHNRKGFYTRLEFLSTDTVLANVTFDILARVLEKYSVDYAASVFNTVRAAFEDGVFDVSEPITTKKVEKWLFQTPLSYWPPLKLYVYQLSCIQNNKLVSEDLRKFILSPEISEIGYSGSGPYFALLTNDPERGALTEQELKSIQAGLNNAYRSGVIRFFEYTVTWFLIATGMRPIQIARMKNKHVRVEDGPAGEAREVTLFVPLVKDTGGKTSAYIRLRAPSVLADILIRYQDMKGEVQAEGSLFDLAVSGDLNELLNRVFSKLDTHSDRIDGPIHITPYRFRYTLATRAIAQGATDAQVARLLTHKSTNSIKHYRASLASTQAPINEALGEEMDFFAGVFSGRIINDFDEATNTGDYNRLIRDFERLTGKKIGACGAKAECYLDAPRACLTCFLFEPFVDADWDSLEGEVRADFDSETEPKIKQIHLDQLNAVQSIKSACAAKLKLLEESAS